MLVDEVREMIGNVFTVSGGEKLQTAPFKYPETIWMQVKQQPVESNRFQWIY